MKKYIPHIIIVVLVLLLLGQCSAHKTDNARSKDIISILQEQVKYYENENGTLTATKGTLQLENSELKDLILDKDAELKNLADEFARVKSFVKYKTVTKFDTIYIAFDTPIDSVPAFERSGSVFNEWYQLGYKVNNTGLQIEPFYTWTETTVITGVKRNWFLGPERITTDITNSNPYIEVNDLKAAEVIVHQPWYKKWWVWAIAGAAGGVMISK